MDDGQLGSGARRLGVGVGSWFHTSCAASLVGRLQRAVSFPLLLLYWDLYSSWWLMHLHLHLHVQAVLLSCTLVASGTRKKKKKKLSREVGLK